MESNDTSDPSFWNDRYLARETGWDKGRTAPPIERMLREGLVVNGASMLVLCAGRGHDAISAARQGYRVAAVDFAEQAAEAIRSASRQSGLEVEVVEADVLGLPSTHPGRFDAALEHLAFCALPPERRQDYARMLHAVLRRGGVYFGLFFAHGRPGGPPFTTSEEELREIFSPLFDIARLVPARDSFPSRAGEELEFVFRRR